MSCTDEPEDACAGHGDRNLGGKAGHLNDDVLVFLWVHLQQLLDHNDAFSNNSLWTTALVSSWIICKHTVFVGHQANQTAEARLSDVAQLGGATTDALHALLAVST